MSNVYLHQIHTLVPGASVENLFAAVEHDYLPHAAAMEVGLVGYWRTTGIQGPSDEAVAVWELNDYRHLERFTRAQFDPSGGEPGLRAWADHQTEWVARTDGLVCEPSEACPTVASLTASGARAAMCTHEIVSSAPNRHAEYGVRLHEMWHTRFSKNPTQPKERHVVGLYYAKWTNTIAINIWGTGETWDSVRIWDPEWEKDPSFDLWNTLGREIRSDFTDRYLVPAPFSTVR